MRSRSSLAVFLVALVLRVGFVWWAPGEPTGDGLFYHSHAVDLAQGNGYVNIDRSPANTWMPGWPAFVAVLYGGVGPHARLAMLANALLGALTAVLVVRFGRRLVGERIGLMAGALYAIWPGLIYYSATLFNETYFSFLFVLTLNLALDAARSDSRRNLRFAAAGVALGACAWVKAEPLVLIFAFAGYFWLVRRSTLHFVRELGVFVVVAVGIVAPWTLRNWVVFDRFLPTVAGGGMVVVAANHEGATGGNDLAFLVAYIEELGVSGATQAEQNLAMNDHGWRDAADFAIGHPGEQLRIVANKLRLTYADDASGADLVRGFFGPEKWHLSRSTWTALRHIANAWWWAMLALCGLGLVRIGRWPLEARVLVFGLLGTWMGLHVVFMGGARFHFPELILLSLVAATGAAGLREAWQARVES